MGSNRRSEAPDIGCDVRSVVLDVLRRRAAGESLPDEQVIAARPELADLLRVELARLKQICAAGDGRESIVQAHASTADCRADSTPGVIQVRCPHCREFFQAPADAPVAAIVCSVCGGHFSIADTAPTTRAAAPLESLAHFDLIEMLGVGGFGAVWKAHDRKLDRIVAVKIPHRGKLNHEDVEKFLREARAAAQLQHPNIVHVHEVGRDGDSPYIVSDFVRGIPLNDWLTDQQPTMRQAAEICGTIADALQHAHDRGVVHRDLKPANVLMDRDGRPYLMDFGLARREAGEVTVTMEGQVLGTPAYMSPEQAQGESHTADGRSDIYSLGVILFELLTGELPFRGNPRMLMHQVLHEDPPRPRKFNSTIPKDLETITLKCLEKEPRRRYATAADLGSEFQRFLAGEPIRARPLSGPGRTWRWARRRPAAAALLALLVLFAAASAAALVRERAWSREVLAQKNEAESERASAEAVVSFLTNDVLSKASPRAMQDKAVRDTLVATLIEPAAAAIGDRFQDKPLVEAAVRRTLAQTLAELGRPDLALPHALAALELRRRALGDEDPDTLTSLDNYALVLHWLGRAEEAEPLFKQALQQRRALLGADHSDTLRSLNNYADVLMSLNRAQEAVPLLKTALDQLRKSLGDDDAKTIAALNNYATALASSGRTKDAEPLLKRALEQRRKTLSENHPDTMMSLSSYALVLHMLGRTDEAEPLFKEALERRRKFLGEDHRDTILSLDNYADLLMSLDRPQEAAPLLKEVFDLNRKHWGEDDARTITARNNYEMALKAVGRIGEAEAIQTDAPAESRRAGL